MERSTEEVDQSGIRAAARAITEGDLVAYPTETVYGLGANARDPDAVARVFDLKGRDRDDPVSVAVGSVDAMDRVVRLDGTERAFADRFLPGPVTLVARRREGLPDVITGGRARVGVRVPDHPVARELAIRAGPITATSANPSGDPGAPGPAALAPAIRTGVAVVLDPDGAVFDPDAVPDRGAPDDRTARERDGRQPSTVVDVDSSVIHRRGARADAVERWLRERDLGPSA